MSSNVRLQKVCQECGREFIARTTVTKFCSHLCNGRYYKREKRSNYLDVALMKERAQRALMAVVETPKKGRPRKQVIPNNFNPSRSSPLTRELLDIEELAVVIGMSERTIHRLLKDISFPRLRVGKRLLFEKTNVINYLTTKYSNR